MPGPTYDLAIIGGGLNGCAIARDAAGRNLSVFLCEQGDLGGGASSNTGRMALDEPPGAAPRISVLRTLDAMRHEEILLKAAPHVVRPLRLLMPRRGGVRAQLRRFGIFAHGKLGARKVLPPVRNIELGQFAAGRDLKPEFRFAQEFSACAVDDSRLVVLNALDARSRGAEIRTRTRCLEARREGWFWKLTLESSETGARWKAVARSLVNAAGPQVGDVLKTVIEGGKAPALDLVKRSYAIARAVFAHDRGFVFPGRRGGFLFAIPYERLFTLIGPVEAIFEGDPADVQADDADIADLLFAVNEYLRVPIAPESIAWTYAGLCATRSAGPRHGKASDLEADIPDDLAPLVSVLGARLVSHRRLAERVLDRLKGHLTVGKPWTARSPLPGGHFAVADGADLVRALRAAYPFVAEIDAERMVNAYGTRAASILSGARRIEDLGERFGVGLTEAEVNHLIKEEWARTASDILWRRSKLGLRAAPEDVAAIEAWLARARVPVAAPAA